MVLIDLAEVQQGVMGRKKLLVTKYAVEGDIGEPENEYHHPSAYIDEARGKTKCRIACSLLERGESIKDIVEGWASVLELLEKIMDRNE